MDNTPNSDGLFASLVSGKVTAVLFFQGDCAFVCCAENTAPESECNREGIKESPCLETSLD
jgi:hypothetical protein